MGDVAKISPHVASTCTQNAIVSLLNIHIIQSRQIYVAIDNPLIVPSISCPISCSDLWNYARAAADVSHADHWPRNGWRCFSHLNKLRDGIQVTRIFRYCSEHQGQPVLKESSINVLDLDCELSLQMPRETPIQHTITPPRVLLFPHPVVSSIPSAPAPACCVLTHWRYAFAFYTLNLNLNTMVNTELHCMQLFI